MGCFLSKFKLGAVPPLQQAAIALVPPRGGLISNPHLLKIQQANMFQIEFEVRNLIFVTTLYSLSHFDFAIQFVADGFNSVY